MSTSPQPKLSTLEQARSRRTRRKLIDSALALWSTDGFDETPVSRICEQAGLSRTAFFYYFARKEDLLLEIALTTSTALSQDWSRLADSDLPTSEVFAELLEVIGRRCDSSPKPLLDRVIAELHASFDRWPAQRGERSDFDEVFAAVFRRGIERGEIRSDYEPETLAAMLTPLVLQGLRIWIRVDAGPAGRSLRRWCAPLLDGAAAP